ncbi:hypothetical protein TNIN_372981 [Trichonephila inaurata madagascariensis]|uniref:Uncharacterized protein n=1 Tax=Trichonephila inaurata madagascariensis TaxID=2747483 RepID=A0A8X6YCM4_9ARAC|nr:hypothetical protein TNIN_372981 [Trichonephila inaurata madagascariensis]
MGRVEGMFTESACLHICLPFDCSFLPGKEGWMTDSATDSGSVEVDHQLSVSCHWSSETVLGPFRLLLGKIGHCVLVYKIAFETEVGFF